MNHVEREILKLAVELYEEALRIGAHFTVAELAEQLAEALASRWADDQSVTQDLIVAHAHATMAKVDRQRLRADTQLALIDDLDRPIPVDGGQRIARRRMRDRDWITHLTNVSDNASRVNASAAKEYARHAALAPHLAAGVDTETAITEWLAANPNGVLP